MNFNKSILSIALSVAAVMFVGCSTDGYWDKAPIDSERSTRANKPIP